MFLAFGLNSKPISLIWCSDKGLPGKRRVFPVHSTLKLPDCIPNLTGDLFVNLISTIRSRFQSLLLLRLLFIFRKLAWFPFSVEPMRGVHLDFLIQDDSKWAFILKSFHETWSFHFIVDPVCKLSTVFQYLDSFLVDPAGWKALVTVYLFHLRQTHQKCEGKSSTIHFKGEQLKQRL